MSPEVQEYLDKLPKERSATVKSLREIILNAEPSLGESISSWGYLTYSPEPGSYILTICPHSRHANLQFHNGAELLAEIPQLEGTGNNLRHIKFNYGKDVDEGSLSKAIRSAIEAFRRNK